MTEITEVAQGVYRFETPIGEMPQVPVVYLINDPQAALIEPGPAAAAPFIQEAMAQLGIERLSYIIPTHMHVDHGGGAGTLARLFPKAKVVVHPRGAKHLTSPDRLIESTRMVWGEDFEKALGPIIPVAEVQVKVAQDGDTVSLGHRELQIIHATGHSPNHIVILDRKLNALFCGEALGLPGHQLPPVAPFSFEQDIYLATIESLRHLKVDMLFYSHGNVETEPGRLASRASETARVYSSMILEAASNHKSQEEIMRLVGADYLRRFGQRVTEKDLEIAVAGYLIYFKSKGVLA
jgi:glyoxylase-like metal-dependent hydrolase (beta-lactamase superfamily II)